MTESGAPPTVLTKYEFVQSVGSLRFSTGNSCRKNRDERPLSKRDFAMNAERWIALHKQMHMVGHDLHAEYFGLMLLTNLRNDVLQAFGYAFNEHLAPIFGTPYHMILARVVDVAVGLVGNLAHRDIIQPQAT